MKHFNYFLALTAVLVLLNTSNYAQNSFDDIRDKKTAIANLQMALDSDNRGLKNSAIFLAGKYRVTELSSSLIDEYYNEEDIFVKKLIVSSLYRIADDNSDAFMAEICCKEKNRTVREFALSHYIASR
ncbi:MAG: hypothetical protein K9I71_06875 [Ignavibacteriales bacterium]|nr:hypothetical protein [Ignavibacteriales bacterium]MCF8315828.1 hypothetical protein [Ignavibacteriales bacterium]MCF8437288.1 hypothetical protein [Ignavibacteriales bacterium]